MYRETAYPCYVQIVGGETVRQYMEKWLKENDFLTCSFTNENTNFIYVSSLAVAYSYVDSTASIHDRGECCGTNLTLFKSLCMQEPEK